jgi:hypothetical protein
LLKKISLTKLLLSRYIMKKILVTLLLFKSLSCFSQHETITIKGKVSDFKNNPVAGAKIILKDSKFYKIIDSTFTDSSGTYSVNLRKGTYLTLAAIKMDDYIKSKLEFWAYNIPTTENLELNIRYDRLEVYGVNVFQVQEAYPGYTIYFRPMSLTRFATTDLSSKIINIAPPPDKIDIRVRINEEDVQINNIQEVIEFGGKQNMNAYLIHTNLSTNKVSVYDKIQITVTDKENGDMGEAVYYKEKN